MSDEPSQKTKTDVLDLIISFIREHEKRMDEIVERMERLSEREYRSRNRIATETVKTPHGKADVFTLTIRNPDDYDKIKAVKIEWEAGEAVYTPELSEIDDILDKIDFTFRDK
jgi:predicted transcriptional regulator